MWPILVKKLSICFNVKDQSKFDHELGVVYYAGYSNKTCRENCIDESGRRIPELLKDYNGRDLKSYILKHFVESDMRTLVIMTLKI